MTPLKLLLLVGAFATALAGAQIGHSTGLEPDPKLLTQGTLSQLRAQYDAAYQIAQQLRERFPEHPSGHTFALNTLITQLAWDDANQRFDKDIRSHAKAALSACKRMIKQNPESFEGYYHCGQAQFALTYLSALRGNYYRAGVAGSATIDYLERALELEPELVDAKLHLGLCYYYADNLPPYIRAFSRLLWFIPTGNSDKSLPYIQEVTETGRLYKSVGQYLYSDILIRSDAGDQALPILQQLVTEYPQNRRFHFRYIALLAQLDQPHKALAAIARFRKVEDCCPRIPADLALATLWEVAVRYQLGQVERAQEAYQQIGPEQLANFPSWGQSFYEAIDEALRTDAELSIDSS